MRDNYILNNANSGNAVKLCGAVFNCELAKCRIYVQ